MKRVVSMAMLLYLTEGCSHVTPLTDLQHQTNYLLAVLISISGTGLPPLKKLLQNLLIVPLLSSPMKPDFLSARKKRIRSINTELLKAL
jgi:hypothetical protein